MANKPTKLPRWATGPGASVVEPSESGGSGSKDTGWKANTAPPAGWFNWLLFTIYSWIAWLDDFTNHSHEWTSKQEIIPTAPDTPALDVESQGAPALRAFSAGRQAILATGGPGYEAIQAIGGDGGGVGIYAAGGDAGGIGVYAAGGADGGVGVYGKGASTGSTSHGVHGIANPAGANGVLGEAYGLATPGVKGEGVEIGVQGNATGTNGVGVIGYGRGTGPGVRGIAGAGAGAGVEGVGTSTAPGGNFSGGSGTNPTVKITGASITTGICLEIATGNVKMPSASNAVPSTEAHRRVFNDRAIPKAWGTIEITCGATPTATILGGSSARYNVGTLNPGANFVQVPFSVSMADEFYTVIAVDNGQNLPPVFVRSFSKTTTGFSFYLWTPGASSHKMLNTGTDVHRISFMVIGGQ